MDDVNINKICLNIEEVQLDGDDEEWIKLNWISNQSDNDGNFQLPETQKDLTNEIDYESTVSFTNTELDDISDGISVITESDIDAVNTNLFQICQFNRTPCKSPQMMEVQISRQKDIWNILIACVLGIIIGSAFNYLFTVPKTCPVSNGVDIESVKLASHNIVNICKELTNVKTMLNEIKTHMPTDRKITEQFLTQFFEITDSSNKTNSKPVMITKEFFNSTAHPFDQLQVSLHVLSSLAFIYDDNSSLRNDINKTLDIVNNTKTFYETLMLYTNNTQNVSHSVILNSLQPNNDKMHITSKLLLSNLAEKVSKITSKVYNKYAKEKHRLNKKLCHLKSILPDDKLLKQLTENNQLFKDYDKSCFSHYTSKHLDDRTITKSNTKTKEHITKTDDTVLHTKYDKKNTHKIHHNDKENFLKSKKNKRQSVDKSTTKFWENTSHKIHKTSQLLFSKILGNMGKLRHQLSKKLHYLKNMLANNSEFLKQLIEDDEQDTKESKFCEGKNDDLQSNVTPKNSFDNILVQLKNTCPLSTNYCPKFNINMSTFDTVPNHKTKNYKHKKHDATNKKIIMDQEKSVKGKNKPKKKDHFKSNSFTKKDNNNKVNYERENISFQNKINNTEHTVNYHKSKHSSFNSRTMKQDNQHYTNTDRRSYEYWKQWLDDSDWYFQRVHSRRNARRCTEQRRFDNSDWYFQRVRSRRNARRRADMYQQNIKWFWKNRH